MIAQTTTVSLPTALVAELEERAAKAGMSLATYLAFLARVEVEGHDSAFVSAAQQLFQKFPKSLKKLAE